MYFSMKIGYIKTNSILEFLFIIMKGRKILKKLDIKSKIKQKSNHHKNYVILSIAVKVLEESLL